MIVAHAAIKRGNISIKNKASFFMLILSESSRLSVLYFPFWLFMFNAETARAPEQRLPEYLWNRQGFFFNDYRGGYLLDSVNAS